MQSFYNLLNIQKPSAKASISDTDKHVVDTLLNSIQTEIRSYMYDSFSLLRLSGGSLFDSKTYCTPDSLEDSISSYILYAFIELLTYGFWISSQKTYSAMKMEKAKSQLLKQLSVVFEQAKLSAKFD